MTVEENKIVADAQAAYQRAMRIVEDDSRRRELFRIGLLGLLECELEIDEIMATG